MENQISNVERGAFDELKELERLWERTLSHIHYIHAFRTKVAFPPSWNLFLMQRVFVFVHPVVSTRTVSANFLSCCFRRMKLCLDCESPEALHTLCSLLSTILPLLPLSYLLQYFFKVQTHTVIVEQIMVMFGHHESTAWPSCHW